MAKHKSATGKKISLTGSSNAAKQIPPAKTSKAPKSPFKGIRKG